MNDIQILTNRYRDIIKSRLSRGGRNDRLKILKSDIRLAYIGKRKPQEIKDLLEEVEGQIC